MISFISYLTTDILLGGIKKLFPCFIYAPIDIVHQIGATDSVIPTANVIVSVLFALIYACFLTKARYENWLFKIANKLRLTRSIDDQPVWEHFFDDNDVVVLRYLVTGNDRYLPIRFRT